MNTFDRHLLREWLQILGLVLVATCGLLLVQVMYDDFRALREGGARGWELWSYFFVTMPSFLTVVLPLAGLIDLEAERARLAKERAKLADEAGRVPRIRLLFVLARKADRAAVAHRLRLAVDRQRGSEHPGLGAPEDPVPVQVARAVPCPRLSPPDPRSCPCRCCAVRSM